MKIPKKIHFSRTRAKRATSNIRPYISYEIFALKNEIFFSDFQTLCRMRFIFSLSSPFGRRFCLGTSSLSFRLHALKASLSRFAIATEFSQRWRPLVRLCSLACRPRRLYSIRGGHNKTWHKGAIVESSTTEYRRS